VRFQVLTAASMKYRVFWDVAPCSHVEVDRRFVGAYCPHHRPDDGGFLRFYSVSADVFVRSPNCHDLSRTSHVHRVRMIHNHMHPCPSLSALSRSQTCGKHYYSANNKRSSPTTLYEGAWGERRYSSYPFSASALDGGGWSALRPDRSLLAGKGPPVPIVQEAGWAPEPVWTQRLEEKSFRLCRGSNLDRPVAQPLAGHYTELPGSHYSTNMIYNVKCSRVFDVPYAQYTTRVLLMTDFKSVETRLLQQYG
jgi:hypothetical protein